MQCPTSPSLQALKIDTDMFVATFEFVSWLFGRDEPRHPLPWHTVVSRSLLVFAVGLVLVRVGKSRLLGRVTPVDVLLGFCLGSVMSRGMTGSASLSATCLSSAALVGLHWALTATACRWHRFGELLKGHSVELVRDGKIDWEAMEQSHMSEHDLLEQLRLNGNVAEVPMRSWPSKNGVVRSA